jgi:hypothetical protein
MDALFAQHYRRRRTTMSRLENYDLRFTRYTHVLGNFEKQFRLRLACSD